HQISKGEKRDLVGPGRRLREDIAADDAPDNGSEDGQQRQDTDCLVKALDAEKRRLAFDLFTGFHMHLQTSCSRGPVAAAATVSVLIASRPARVRTCPVSGSERRHRPTSMLP